MHGMSVDISLLVWFLVALLLFWRDPRPRVHLPPGDGVRYMKSKEYEEVYGVSITWRKMHKGERYPSRN